MNTHIYTEQDAQNNFSTILSFVVTHHKQAFIKRGEKVIATLLPLSESLDLPKRKGEKNKTEVRSLAGLLPLQDADEMKKAIAELRDLPERADETHTS